MSRNFSLLTLLALGLAAATASAQIVPVGVQSAIYDFENADLVSTDTDPDTVASNLTPALPVMFASGNICFGVEWSSTTAQGPFNNSQSYIEWTVDPNSGIAMTYTALEIITQRGGGLPDFVDFGGLYADEEPGAGGDNFQTLIGSQNLFPQGAAGGVATVTFDLTGATFLAAASEAVTFRLYLWGSANSGTSNAEFQRMTLIGEQGPPKAKIGNRVFVDTDCNGIQGSSDTNLGGVTVNLYDVNSATPNTPVQSTTTGSDGAYEFCVDAGTYRVGFVTPSGYVVTNPGQGNDSNLDSDAPLGFLITTPITVASGETRNDIDAGFCVCTGSAAVSMSLGSSCNQALDPIISSNQPVLGTQVTIDLQSAFPNALLLPFFSFGPVTPFQIGNTGCTVFVDAFNPGNLFMPGQFFTDQNGNWDLTFILPNDAMLAGLEFIFQLRICAPNGPAGPLSPDWASNGLLIRLGCP